MNGSYTNTQTWSLFTNFSIHDYAIPFSSQWWIRWVTQRIHLVTQNRRIIWVGRDISTDIGYQYSRRQIMVMYSQTGYPSLTSRRDVIKICLWYAVTYIQQVMISLTDFIYLSPEFDLHCINCIWTTAYGFIGFNLNFYPYNNLQPNRFQLLESSLKYFLTY